MARPLRIEFPGAVYYVTGRGHPSQRIFLDDEDRREFFRSIAEAAERFNWRCHAYCLLDETYHLLIETPEPTLSRGMRQLGGLYTQRFNRRHGHDGPVFRGRFKATVLERDPYLLEVARELALQPVRAGLAAAPEQWFWSSHRAMTGQAAAPAWLQMDWVLGQFAPVRDLAQRMFAQFVLEGAGRPEPWAHLRGQISLGSDEFCRHFVDAPPVHQLAEQFQPDRPTLAAIFVEGEDPRRHVRAAYITHGYRLNEIAHHLCVHESTISRWLRSSITFAPSPASTISGFFARTLGAPPPQSVAS